MLNMDIASRYSFRRRSSEIVGDVNRLLVDDWKGGNRGVRSEVVSMHSQRSRAESHDDASFGRRGSVSSVHGGEGMQRGRTRSRPAAWSPPPAGSNREYFGQRVPGRSSFAVSETPSPVRGGINSMRQYPWFRRSSRVFDAGVNAAETQEELLPDSQILQQNSSDDHGGPIQHHSGLDALPLPPVGINYSGLWPCGGSSNIALAGTFASGTWRPEYSPPAIDSEAISRPQHKTTNPEFTMSLPALPGALNAEAREFVPNNSNDNQAAPTSNTENCQSPLPENWENWNWANENTWEVPPVFCYYDGSGAEFTIPEQAPPPTPTTKTGFPNADAPSWNETSPNPDSVCWTNGSPNQDSVCWNPVSPNSPDAQCWWPHEMQVDTNPPTFDSSFAEKPPGNFPPNFGCASFINPVSPPLPSPPPVPSGPPPCLPNRVLMAADNGSKISHLTAADVVSKAEISEEPPNKYPDVFSFPARPRPLPSSPNSKRRGSTRRSSKIDAQVIQLQDTSCIIDPEIHLGRRLWRKKDPSPKKGPTRPPPPSTSEQHHNLGHGGTSNSQVLNAAVRIKEVDPVNHQKFVSNIKYYASSRNWEEVDGVIKEMSVRIDVSSRRVLAEVTESLKASNDEDALKRCEHWMQTVRLHRRSHAQELPGIHPQRNPLPQCPRRGSLSHRRQSQRCDLISDRELSSRGRRSTSRRCSRPRHNHVWQA